MDIFLIKTPAMFRSYIDACIDGIVGRVNSFKSSNKCDVFEKKIFDEELDFCRCIIQFLILLLTFMVTNRVKLGYWVVQSTALQIFGAISFLQNNVLKQTS